MKIGKIIGSVFSVVMLFVIYYLWLPTLSLAYFDGFVFIALCAAVVLGNIAMWISGKEEGGGVNFFLVFGVVLLITAVLSIGGTIVGSTIFNADTMHNQLGTPKEVEFDDLIQQIDLSQIPIVNRRLAVKQADKKMGEDIALGSRAELGSGSVQKVNGEILWVFPIEHSGFFKWNSYKTTPGYITVSASNQNKVNYVSSIDGNDIQLAYTTSACFGNDLVRHIRNSGFRTVGLTEFTFEIDDTGYPYWVVTTYKNRTLWGNKEATGVVIVDAQTGEVEWYSVDDVPEWVSIVQPEKAIENQIDHWGELVHGFWNTVFAKKDMIKKTDLLLTVFDGDDCYYFTGMTSVGSDNSCVGFIMVNTRTKESYISYMSGATESAAMSSAQGLVSDFGYTSTEPLPLNVNGVPTYVMALQDAEGLNKAYAMVNINQYSITAKGTSLQEASRAYMQAMGRESGSQVVGSDDTYGYTYEGVVLRISDVIVDGNTYYYIVVDGEEEKIFTASFNVSEELSVTRDGDTVKLYYVDDGNGTMDIINFENVAYAIQKSEDQNKRDELDEGTSQLDPNHSSVVDVNPELNESTWDSLTDEEKAQLMDEYLSSISN